MTFDVTLVLLSFVLAWSEMWFLDVRVLPLELRASELMEEFEHDERASLLGNHRHPVHSSGLLGRYVEAGSLWGESVANFYSPLESPEDSGDEIEEETLVRIPRRFKRKAPLNDKVRCCNQMETPPLRRGAWLCIIFSMSALMALFDGFFVLCRNKSIANLVNTLSRPPGKP